MISTDKIKRGIRNAVIYSLFTSFVLSSGCASTRAYRHPTIEGDFRKADVTVVEHGININEKGLEKKVENSVFVNDDNFKNFKNSWQVIKDFLSKYMGDSLIVESHLGSLVDDSYLIKENRGLEINLDKEVYSNEEIRNILNSNNIPYIEIFGEPREIDGERSYLVKFYVTQKKGKDLLERKLKEIYPNRLEQRKEELEKEYEEQVNKNTKKLVNMISENNNIYICLTGIVNPFMPNRTWYTNELKLNQEALSFFFNEHNFTEFNIERNEESFKNFLDFIKKYSDESYNLIIFYHGHGTKEGLSIEFNNHLEPKEIEESFKGFKGNAILIANCCFSGDFRDYFENNNLPMTVVSSSKNGEPVSTNEFGKPGYMVQDLVKSDLDLKNFEKNFKDVPKGKYYPKIYIPLKCIFHRSLNGG